MRKLTIGMLTHTDFDGCFFAIQSIRMFHPEVMDEIEFLVLDNSPEGPHGKAVENFTKWVKEPIQYVPVEGGGTALRTRIFEMATTDYVLCMDAHVLLVPGSLRKLIDFFDSGRDDGNLLQGPLLYDDLRNVSTHFEPVWRDQMWGIWATAWKCRCGHFLSGNKLKVGKDEFLQFREMIDGCIMKSCVCGAQFPIGWSGHENELRKAGFVRADESEEPFEIPAQGLGVFACRKDSWLGFNTKFLGFGGEEVYLHEKYRQAVKKTLCLPFLRWVHRFGRPDGIHYVLRTEDRVRNYLIGHAELGLDPSPVIEHFTGKMPKERLDALMEECFPAVFA